MWTLLGRIFLVNRGDINAAVKHISRVGGFVSKLQQHQCNNFINDSRQPSALPFYTLPKNKEKNLAVVHFIFLRTKKKKGTFIRSRMKFSASKKDHEWIVLFVKHLTKSITFLIIAQKIKKTTHYLNDWNKDPPLFRGISQNTKKDLCKKMSVCIIVFDS